MSSKTPLPLSDVYGLLEPGPVVLLATANKGRRNVMTLSWHTMMEFEPPLVGCVVSRANFSHALLKGSRACTINIPSTTLADAVVGCGNTSGRDTEKFAGLGLRTSPGSLVEAPLIDACFASLECRVADTKLVASYDFFVLEVVAAWIDRRRRNARTLHHRGWGAFMKAGPTVQLPSRMRRALGGPSAERAARSPQACSVPEREARVRRAVGKEGSVAVVSRAVDATATLGAPGQLGVLRADHPRVQAIPSSGRSAIPAGNDAPVGHVLAAACKPRGGHPVHLARPRECRRQFRFAHRPDPLLDEALLTGGAAADAERRQQGQRRQGDGRTTGAAPDFRLDASVHGNLRD